MGILCYFLADPICLCMRYICFLSMLLFACNTDKYMQTRTYPATDNFLSTLLHANSTRLGPVFTYPDSFQLQVIYTRIDRDADNQPHFRDYYYRVDTGHYFYPASTVKLPGAILALEKLNDLHIPGLDRNTPMFTECLHGITNSVLWDPTAPDSLPSIAHYINKVFLVSDNDAFNRLYEFIGQQALNERLWQMGYSRTQIRTRTGTGYLPADSGRHTNAIWFTRNGQEVYHQPDNYSHLVFAPRHDSAGLSHFRRHPNTPDELVPGAMDFSEKNRLPLPDIHMILKSIIFPEAVTKEHQFRLTEDDYRFLYHSLSRLPTETRYPAYDTSEFYPAYVKFLLFGGERDAQMPPYIRIFNKPGWAYGYLTDVAYIADFAHNIEFMLSATVYVNKSGNIDGHYEFNETGKPFMKALGQVIYEYELKRKRKYPANLARYK